MCVCLCVIAALAAAGNIKTWTHTQTCGHVTHVHTHAHTRARTHSFTSDIFHSTWKNALLGEKVIEDLEDRSAALSKEKQDYIGTW